MGLPDYIGIREKDKKFDHYQISIYEDGHCISTSKVLSDEALLDEIERIILKDPTWTFEVFEVNVVPIEYEDKNGDLKIF